MNDLVSVVITTYNRSHLVPRAIQSVLEQSYKNIEIIIIDDCSTDTTEKTLQKYRSRHCFYIRNKKNIGVSASRNIGISLAKGIYISFLDDDDEISPLKIKEQLQLFEKNLNLGAVYCHSLKISGDNTHITRAQHKGHILKHVISQCPNALHTFLIKRKCINHIGGFDENLTYGEDWDFWIRLSKYYPFDFVDKCLVTYHVHGQQTSCDIDSSINGRKKIIAKHFNTLQQYPNILSWHYRLLGSKYAIKNDALTSKKYLLKSIQTSPFNIGSYIHLLLLLSFPKLHQKIICRWGMKTLNNIQTY